MPTFLECAYLADAAYTPSQAPPGFRQVPAPPSVSARGRAFSGSLFMGQRVGIVSYKGSDETTDWMHSDTDIASSRIPEQLGDAFALFSAARKLFQGHGCLRVVVVGHSLGGALAALVGARVTSFPVRALTFNAPGCVTFTRAGRWVDEEDALLAASVDAVKKAFTPQGALDIARGLAAVPVAAGLAAHTAAKRGMEALSGVSASAQLNIPKSNQQNVYNVIATTRSGSQEFVSRYRPDFIGKPPYIVPVEAHTRLDAHMMNPLIKALVSCPVGAYTI